MTSQPASTFLIEDAPVSVKGRQPPKLAKDTYYRAQRSDRRKSGLAVSDPIHACKLVSKWYFHRTGNEIPPESWSAKYHGKGPLSAFIVKCGKHRALVNRHTGKVSFYKPKKTGAYSRTSLLDLSYLEQELKQERERWDNWKPDAEDAVSEEWTGLLVPVSWFFV